MTGEAYSYASGNPLSYTDPLGLWSQQNTWNSIAGFLDGVTGIPIASTISNAIAPGSVQLCSPEYGVANFVGNIASTFMPGIGQAKAVLLLGGLALKGAVIVAHTPMLAMAVPIFVKGKNFNFFEEIGRKAANNTVKQGQMGPYKTLKGQVGDGLEAHHMPSVAALKNAGHTNTNNGFALVLSKETHKQTRTFGSRNASIVKNEANLDLNDILKRDLDDISSLLGDSSIKDAAIQWYKNNPPSWFDISKF